MPASLKLRGVDELLAELETLPRDLTQDTQPVLKSTTETAADTVRSAYRVVTGALREGVRVLARMSPDPYRLHARIDNTARHAPFYEFGTARTKSTPTFVPITIRARRAFKADVVAIVRSHGLQVTGDKD